MIGCGFTDKLIFPVFSLKMHILSMGNYYNILQIWL